MNSTKEHKHNNQLKSNRTTTQRLINSINLQIIEQGELAYWKNPKPNDQKHKAQNVSLYSGSTGIAVPMVEFFHLTNDEKYLTYAIKASNYAHSIEEKKAITSLYKGNSLYSGNNSTTYLNRRLYESTGNELFADRMENATRSINMDDAKKLPPDLLTGLSGTILAALHTYSIRQTKENFKILDQLLEMLLLKTKRFKDSYFWGDTRKGIKPLCGLSHGVSGVSLALLQSSIVLKSSELLDLAECGLKYEEYCFNGEWPDFRVPYENGTSTQEIAKTIEHLKNVPSRKSMNRWCHGAAGIALVRHAHFEQTRKPSSLLQLNHAKKLIEDELQTTLSNSETHDFSLCHGLGGILDTLNTISRSSNPDSKLISIATERMFSNFTHSSILRETEDNSLMNGRSGVALTMIRSLAPQTPSILLPTVTTTESAISDKEETSKTQWPTVVAKTIYPRTYKKIVSKKGQYPSCITPLSLDRYLEKLEAKKYIEFEIDSTVQDLESISEGQGTLIFWKKYIESMLPSKKEKLRFLKTNPYLTTGFTKSLKLDTPTNPAKKATRLLIYKNYLGIQTTPINNFIHELICLFENGFHVNDVLKRLETNNTYNQGTTELILQQIVELLTAQVLLPKPILIKDKDTD